jgi:tRNA(Ile)-lysidine synthase
MHPLSLPESIESVFKGLGAGEHLYIAYSGGVDSQVLLHVVSTLVQAHQIDATALHVNHGLSPNAHDWQDFCARQCESLGLPLLCKPIDLGEPSGSGLEVRAREARYAWFETLLGPGDVLLTAHHGEDQAETFVLRALRGSGVRGLAAIPVKRALGCGCVIRPFLDQSKAELQAYAELFGLSWIDDESNASLKFDRNFVRHEILPLLATRWPQVSRQLARSAQNCRDDQLLLDELAELDASTCQLEANPLYFEGLPPLNLAAFTVLSFTRQRNILQYLLRPLLAYPVPHEQMNEWLRQVNQTEPGANSELVLPGLSLILHDEQLHFSRCPASKNVPESLEWRTSSPLLIGAYGYALRLVPQATAPGTNAKTLAFEPGETVCVHWRQGGERVQRPGEEFSRSLKKLYQEKKLAPWLRRAMPLISLEGYIVWSALLGDFAPRLRDAQGHYYSFELCLEDQIKFNC